GRLTLLTRSVRSRDRDAIAQFRHAAAALRPGRCRRGWPPLFLWARPSGHHPHYGPASEHAPQARWKRTLAAPLLCRHCRATRSSAAPALSTRTSIAERTRAARRNGCAAITRTG